MLNEIRSFHSLLNSDDDVSVRAEADVSGEGPSDGPPESKETMDFDWPKPRAYSESTLSIRASQ